MFQKLRSDLVRELSPIRLLLVNAGGFSSNGVNPSLSLGLNGNQIEQLRDSGVVCIKEYMDSPRDSSCMKMRIFNAISVILIMGKEDRPRLMLNFDIIC